LKIVRLLIVGILLSGILTDCVPGNTAVPVPSVQWKYADLHILDLPNATDSDLDIIALYSRWQNKLLEIRLDFLGNPKGKNFQLFVTIKTHPGGITILPGNRKSQQEWNLATSLSDNKIYSTDYTQGGSPIPGCSSNWQNLNGTQSVIITLNCPKYLQMESPGMSIEVQIYQGDSLVPIDQIGPVNLNTSPPQHAPLLMAFWQSFPATTPAQALRRWDGAHTGPFGQRHGLFHLIKASSENNIPIVLVDLKTPTSLSALDYLGQLDWIEQQEKKRLLILPETAYGDPSASNKGLANSRQISAAMGLNASQLAYGSLNDAEIQKFQAIFAVLPQTNHILKYGNTRLVPLPDSVFHPQLPIHQVANRDGLLPELKVSLLSAALSGDPANIVVIGGDVSKSALADSSIAYQAFQEISLIPWIQPLGIEDLLTLPAVPATSSLLPSCSDVICSPEIQAVIPQVSPGTPAPSEVTLAHLQTTFRKSLSDLPKNSITDSAWEMYLNLTVPTSDPRLQQLQANNLILLGHLIAAARWVDNPSQISDCQSDLDLDGLPECVIASDSMFSSYEMEGGRLIYWLIRTPTGANILTGPSAQAGMGSDSSSNWRLNLGPWAEAHAIPGAFSDSPNLPIQRYSPEISSSSLKLVNPINGSKKIFELGKDGIQITLQNQTAEPLLLPLLIGVESRFSPQWAERDTNNLFPTGKTNGITFQTQGIDSQSLTSFIDSVNQIRSPEDPDFDYPPGHYLPFPLTIIEFKPQRDIKIVKIKLIIPNLY
jgi:hypothetical protein